MKRVILKALALSIGLHFVASPAFAANVLLNGSFESTLVAITPDTAPAYWGEALASGTQELTDWTVVETGAGLANGDPGNDGGPYIAGNSTTTIGPKAGGGNTFLLFDQGTTTITQGMTVSGAGTVGISYDTLLMTFNVYTNPTIRIELFDGADATAASLYDSGTFTLAQADQWKWISHSSGTISNTGTQLFLRATLKDTDNGVLGAIDNIVVDYTAAIPEPTVTAFAAFGLLGLLNHRRSRLG